MRKLKKTKRIKKQKRIKKTRKLIRIGGGIGDFFRNLFTTRPAKQAHEARDSPVATTLMKGAEPLPFPAPITELQPIKVNTINGDAIYRVKLEGRDYYFFGRNMQYVVMDNIKQIFKLDEDAPDLPQKTIDMINAIDFEALIENAKTNRGGGFKAFNNQLKELATMGILYFSHEGCTNKRFNLDAVNKKLIELNKSLHSRNTNLSLYIDYVYNHKIDSILELYETNIDVWPINPYSLVLCLYEYKHCISSITIARYDVDQLSLDSYTHPKYENKKYNTLLRCTLIIITPLLSLDIKLIRSDAMNPASAYILITYLGGKLDDDDYRTLEFVKFAETHSINIYGSKTDLQELLRLYDDTRKYHGLMVIVELSDENIQKAEEQFHYILETKIK